MSKSLRLSLKDGTPLDIWRCQWCVELHRTESDADACCRACPECGIIRDSPGGCDACRRRRFAEQEAKDLAEAAKTGDPDKPVFFDGRYFPDLESLEDWFDARPEIERPKFVFSSFPQPAVNVSMDGILENIKDDSWEDFDENDIEGWDEFEAAVDRLNEANKDVVAWWEDRKVAVEVSEPFPDKQTEEFNA